MHDTTLPTIDPADLIPFLIAALLLLATYSFIYIFTGTPSASASASASDQQITTSMKMEGNQLLFKTSFPPSIMQHEDALYNRSQARDLCRVHRETPHVKKVFMALLIAREISAQVWTGLWYYWLFRLLRYTAVDFFVGFAELVKFVQPFVAIFTTLGRW